MSGDIIVVARPFAKFAQTDSFALTGGTAAGPGVAMGQQAAAEMIAKDNVKVDPDSNTPDIVVVANKLKDDLTRVAVVAAIASGGGAAAGFNVACVGRITFAEIGGNAKNMTFRLGSTNYGPGRAGENLVGSSGNQVPINMNAGSALAYSNLTNGTLYLITHEIAHSLAIMQQYNNDLWSQYVARSGTGMTQDQLKAAYPDSPEFMANEARSNTVARAIALALGMGAMSPDPMYGYQTC